MPMIMPGSRVGNDRLSSRLHVSGHDSQRVVNGSSDIILNGGGNFMALGHGDFGLYFDGRLTV